MAKNKWLGSALAVVQVDTYTPGGTIEADDLFILTISGFDGSTEIISVAAGGTTVADVTAALVAAWNASTLTLVSTITAVDNTTDLTLVADTAGVEFQVTQTTTEAGGGAADAQTFGKASTVANTGPNNWDDADNWSEGTIPGATASEDTYVEDSAIDILYGLDQSGAAQTLTSLHIPRTYTGRIGHNGATGLVGDYLQLKVTKAFIGEHFAAGDPVGSDRIKIDFGSTQATIIVYFMAISVDTPKPAFRMLANNASTIIQEIRKGSVGVATSTGETSTIGSALVSFDTSADSDASLEIGSGVTITTLDCRGGSTYMFTAATTITSKRGTLTIAGVGTVGTLNVNGGNVESSSTGTITLCTITAGLCDFTRNAEARTVTTCTLDAPGILQYDQSIVTMTNKVEPAGTGRVQYRSSEI